jgi:hypothetical protein
MKYIDDVKYGILYLSPLIDRWYIGCEEDYPYYYKLDETYSKVIEATRTIPEVVWRKFTK